LALWLVLSGASLMPVAHAVQSSWVGAPPVEQFKTDLEVFPQNFDVVQDARGIVYVGNYDGVLEFDGERWRLIRLPNGDLARALALGQDDTIYVGGYDTFGYLKRDATGFSQYVDLSSKFRAKMGGREIGDIWQVLVTDEGVYFRALQDVMFWNPKTGATDQWNHMGRFGAIAKFNGKVMLQFREEGFKVFENGEWRLRADTSHLKTLIGSLVPLADGGLLTIGEDGKWWHIDSNSVRPAKLPAGMRPSSDYYRGMMLPDKSVALITVDGRISFLDNELASKQDLKLEAGNLTGLSLARNGGVLVAGQQQIYRVAWPSSWTLLGEEHGATGDFDKIAEWNGKHYLMTSTGALRMEHQPNGVRFEHMPWSIGPMSDLIPLDANHALAGDTYRLILIENGKARQLSKEIYYPRFFRASKFHPGRIFMGTLDGLRMIDTRGGGIKVSAVSPSKPSPHIVMMVERSATDVWVSTERHGVWRFTLSAAGDITAAEAWGADKGLKYSKVAESTIVATPDGNLVVATRKGIFRLDGDRFVDHAMDGLAALRTPEDLLTIAVAANGDQWANGVTRVYQRPKGGKWVQHEVRALRRGALNYPYIDSAGQVVFVSSNSLLLHNAQSVGTDPPPSKVMLRAVTQVMPDGTAINLPLAGGEPLHLPTGDYGLRFDAALPELVAAGAKKYQIRLVPIDGMSSWGQQSRYEYSDLRIKTYRMEISAMDSKGRVTSIEPFSVTIDPPWYGTTWANALAVIVATTLAWLALVVFARYRTSRLEQEKHQLEAKVEARTRELGDAIRRLDMMAHVDGLTGVPNRRRLDEYLQAVWSNCREQSKPLSMLAIDVDHFKQYNDRHGHLAGDELLKDLVRECLACLRRTEDLLARYGGEEFVVVLPGADVGIARALAESMRAAVANSSMGVTVSIGVSTALPDDAAEQNALFTHADEALYAAKRAGRNRVCVWGESDCTMPAAAA
jgi:diguanylate cyclase (GGDEF)-like protein